MPIMSIAKAKVLVESPPCDFGATTTLDYFSTSP